MSVPSGYKQSVAVPLPSDGDIRAVIGEDYDPDTTLNVIKMFAGTGEFYPALIGMVRAIFGTPDIDAKHREMIILRAASILDVPYEWQANKVFAANAGLTGAEIEATTSDGPVSGVAPDYVLICAATDELLRTGTLTDDTLSTMLDTFGPGSDPQVHRHDLVVQHAESVPERHARATRDHRQGWQPHRPTWLA